MKGQPAGHAAGHGCCKHHDPQAKAAAGAPAAAKCPCGEKCACGHCQGAGGAKAPATK